MNEDTPLTAAGGRARSDPYLWSKVEASSSGASSRRRDCPRVTIHPGTVIGPDDAAMGTSSGIVTGLLRGGVALDSHAPWVDVRDVARGIVLALDQPAGSRFGLTSGVVRHRDLAAMIDELTGRQATADLHGRVASSAWSGASTTCSAAG